MQGYIDNDLMMRVLSIGGHELPLLVNCVFADMLSDDDTLMLMN